jgi:hypothetical protein
MNFIHKPRACYQESICSVEIFVASAALFEYHAFPVWLNFPIYSLNSGIM